MRVCKRSILPASAFWPAGTKWPVRSRSNWPRSSAAPPRLCGKQPPKPSLSEHLRSGPSWAAANSRNGMDMTEAHTGVTEAIASDAAVYDASAKQKAGQDGAHPDQDNTRRKDEKKR